MSVCLPGLNCVAFSAARGCSEAMEFATIGKGAGGFDFVPIAVETEGRLGTDALRMLSELGDVAAAATRIFPRQLLCDVRWRIWRVLCAATRACMRVYASLAAGGKIRRTGGSVGGYGGVFT